MADRAIICVDDEPLILISLIQELKNLFGSRYHYEKASDANTAFRIIDDLATNGIRVILILSDWLMPGIKGDEFLDLVHQQYPHIRTIIITGHIDQAATDRIRQNSSVITILRKPWNSEELKSHIQAVFENSPIQGGANET